MAPSHRLPALLPCARMSRPVVTRFAPSPSGHLHIGNARTALLNFLAARQAGGRFLLRIEDTDESRSFPEYEASALEDLRWLGIDWDEGPDVGGAHGPYRQRSRAAIYADWLERLSVAGRTYPCFCTQAELALARRRQQAVGIAPRYPGTCRNLSPAERDAKRKQGLPAAARFRVPDGRVVEFDDVAHGRQVFRSEDIGDFIVRRTDGSAAFFFSNAIDDALMGVTLVLRGDDHLANTPRQILLLEALGLEAPRYGHVALLLGMDGVPLAKRHGATSLRELGALGYLPEALRNHLARLGHSYSDDGWREDSELIAGFDLGRLGRAPARFDPEQLAHWQKEAVTRSSEDHLLEWLRDALPAGLDRDRALEFARAVRHNVLLPPQAREWAEIVFGDRPVPEADALAAIHSAGADFFDAALAALRDGSPGLKSVAKRISQRTGRKGPSLYMPLRAAITGRTHGPELATLFALMSTAQIGDRFEAAQRLAAAAPIAG